MLDAVHHVAIICSDGEQARRFYLERLGCELLRETRRLEDTKLDLRLAGIDIELFIKPGAPARLTYPEACGLRHLAFRVQSVAEAACWLAERDIPCEPIRLDDIDHRPMTFFQDPDGLPIELHE